MQFMCTTMAKDVASCMSIYVCLATTTLALLLLPNYGREVSELELRHLPFGFEEECEALMEFKDGFDTNPDQLTSWVLGSNCCRWHGVTCHLNGHDIGRVKWLVLQGEETSFLARDATNYPDAMILGVSLSNLHYLQQLILRRVFFNSPIPAAWGKLSGLVHLELSENNFTGGIPHGLSQLSVMRTLSMNYLEVQAQELCSVVGGMRPRSVDLSRNRFHGSIPACMSHWYSVQRLVLSDNFFTGSIPPSFGNLSNLHTLDLGQNLLSGPIPAEIARLPRLQSLSLARNQLIGIIPPELANLKTLVDLDVASNWLSGGIPPSLGLLPKLEVLILSKNVFTGTIPSELGNLSALHELSLGDNRLSGPVPPQLGSLKDLRLDLSNNFFTGRFPLPLCHLMYVDMSGNLLSALQLTDDEHILRPENASTLQSLYLDRNDLEGPIPSWLLFSLAKLTFLSLSHNRLSGLLPLASFLQHPALISVDLSANSFSPSSLPAEKFEPPSGIDFLALQNCALRATIPPGFLATLSNVLHLDLAHNHLSGPIPPDICRLRHLRELDVSFNSLSGMLPSCLHDQFAYSYLDISNNSFTLGPS